MDAPPLPPPPPPPPPPPQPPARPARRGCGRRKIEIKLIEDQRKRWVSFSKRKKGLLSKAATLSKISGEDIGVVIISEKGRLYTSENADDVLQRFKEIVKIEEEQKNDERDDQEIVEDDQELDHGRDDGKSGDVTMVSTQQGLKQWYNFMGVEDEENIQGDKFSFDLNKTPDHD